MSRTVVVGCEDTQVWAFDLALGIWLKLALDVVARKRQSGEPGPDDPGDDELHDWERVAVLGSESVLDLTPRAATAARQVRFAEIGRAVAAWLAARGHIAGEELASWRLLGTEPISRADVKPFCVDGFATAPVLSLGDALIAMVEHRLPAAPPGTWWFFGTASEPSTIAMRERLF